MNKTQFKISFSSITNEAYKIKLSKTIKFYIDNNVLKDFIDLTNKKIHSYQSSFYLVVAFFLTNILLNKTIQDNILNQRDNEENLYNKDTKKPHLVNNKMMIDYRFYNKFIKVLNHYLTERSQETIGLTNKSIIKALMETIKLLIISENEFFLLNEEFYLSLNIKLNEFFDINENNSFLSQFRTFDSENTNLKDSIHYARSWLSNDATKLIYFLNLNSSNTKILFSEELIKNKEKYVLACQKTSQSGSGYINLFPFKYLVQKDIISLINQIEDFKLKINNEIISNKHFKYFIEAVYENDENIFNTY